MSRLSLGILLILLAGTAHPALSQDGRVGREEQQFDHWQHRRLFPSCTSCHAGAIDSTLGLWPSGQNCADCHDGKVEKPVKWEPPLETPVTNLRFTHQSHAEA
ncbi:MAG TPA: cytochrome c3 family protein, partial [Gemmatimonadales bacterium]